MNFMGVIMIKINFNENWTFSRRNNVKDTVSVTLPHDAMLYEPRTKDNPSESAGAYFAGGEYEYRKYFDVPIDWKGKQILLQFEGIYQTAEVYVNNQMAAEIFNGYAITEIDISSYLDYEKENNIWVIVHNQNQPNSRWYSGAGIYRPVWLYVTETDGIAFHGIQIRTISHEPAQVQVMVTHSNGIPFVSLLDRKTVVASAQGEDVILEIPSAKLWSAEEPNLYQCKVELQKDGKTIDEQIVDFGVRTITWSPKGLFINGKETLLRGSCVHHDNGIVGACGYEEAEWRRVRIMKENGFNAIRSSHNPCSEAMLKACDALGMYMMDETWDMWYNHKSKYDYASFFQEHYQEDLRTFVKRDYNHPSVILYSIGNEVSEPASAKGQALEKEMVDLLHQLDASRPVTGGFNLMILNNAAKGQLMYNEDGGINHDTANTMEPETPPTHIPEMNSTIFNMMTQQIGSNMNHSVDSEEADKAISPALDILDIAGYNYASGRYPLEGKKHPERIILGSETFPQEIYQNWEMVKNYPYLIGDFMWTAWDYLGEAGIGCWSCHEDAMGFHKPYPWLIGGAGVINILGDPDGEALYNKIVWELEKGPYIAVRPVNEPEEKLIKSAWRGTNAIPAWSWRGCEGNNAHVEVYGNGAEAEIFLNNISLGRKPLENFKCEFDLLYHPGTLKAILYAADKSIVGHSILTSAEGSISVRIHPETKPVAGKLLYVNIDLCGENGIVECNMDQKLCVKVEGGELLGFGSANPHTEESFLDGRYTTFRGRAQAVVRVQETDKFHIYVKTEN